MHNSRRSPTTQLGVAVLFLSLTAIPVSLKAIGINLRISPSLRALTDAWVEISSVVSNGQSSFAGQLASVCVAPEITIPTVQSVPSETSVGDLAYLPEADFQFEPLVYSTCLVRRAQISRRGLRPAAVPAILPRIDLARIALVGSKPFRNIMMVKAELEARAERNERIRLALARSPQDAAKRTAFNAAWVRNLDTKETVRVLLKLRTTALTTCSKARQQPAQDRPDLIILSAGEEQLAPDIAIPTSTLWPKEAELPPDIPW